MKKKLRENLALFLFVLVVFCLAHAINSSSPRPQIAIETHPAAFSTVSCSLPGCGYDPYLFVENAVHASSIQPLNH